MAGVSGPPLPEADAAAAAGGEGPAPRPRPRLALGRLGGARDVGAAVALGLLVGLGVQVGTPWRGAFGARITGDEPFYLLTTASLVRDGDLDLANQYATESYREFWREEVPLWSQSAPTADGRVLSPHNLGLSVLVLPAYVWNGLEGVKSFLGALAGLTMACAYLLARSSLRRRLGACHPPGRQCARGGPGGRIAPAACAAAAVLVGLSAPVVVYATQIYPEMPAALCVVLLAWLACRPGGGVARAVGSALLLAALLWLGVKYLPLAAVLAVVAWGQAPPRGRLVLSGLGVVLGVHYVWFHLATYGGLTPYAVNLVYAGSSTPELIARHLEVVDRLYRLLGLWVDREFGLVRWAPILVLALPGFWLWRGPRWLPLLIGVQLLVATFLSITMRGWWFPGRMLVVVLPLLVPLVAVALEAAVPRRGLAVLSIGLGMATLSATVALWEAASAGRVALAINPVEAGGWWLTLTGPLFPLYTQYGPDTLALSLLWLALGAALVRAVVPQPSWPRLMERSALGPAAPPGRQPPGPPQPPPAPPSPTPLVSARGDRAGPLSVLVVGGGPAGLAAAYRLSADPSVQVTLIERAARFGGLAAGLERDGMRLDFGPHRLHQATDPEVLADLRSLLGPELRLRPRRGRIVLGGRSLPYPPGPGAGLALGPRLSARLARGLLFERSVPGGDRRTYEAAVVSRVGRPLYELFYGPYARKVWGLPGHQIAAEQAARRVNQRGAGDFLRLLGGGDRGARFFYYPEGGFGRIPAAYVAALSIRPNLRLWAGTAVHSVQARAQGGWLIQVERDGQSWEAAGRHLVWSAPITELVRALGSLVPEEVRQAAGRLRYRAIVLAYAELPVPRIGWADTIYFPEQRFPFNRVAEQKNFSPRTVPDDRTVLVMDLACDPDDRVFTASDEALRAEVTAGLAAAGLLPGTEPVGFWTQRFRFAYPVYDLHAAAALATLHGWADHLPDLWLIGRQGLFLHNNTHHSLLMGYRAAEAVRLGWDRARWQASLEEFSRFTVAD